MTKTKFKVDLLKDGKQWVTERENVPFKEMAEQVAAALNAALRPDQKNLKYVVTEA